MYVHQSIMCECGALMIQAKVQESHDLIRVSCLSRSCESKGKERFVKLPLAEEVSTIASIDPEFERKDAAG